MGIGTPAFLGRRDFHRLHILLDHGQPAGPASDHPIHVEHRPAWLFLLLASIVILVGSALLDGLPAIIILYPILLPIAAKLGPDPLHFTLVMVAAEGIGIILPPVGFCLIVICGISKVSLAAVTKPLLPFVLGMFVSLLVIMYLPWITLVVPRIFGLY